MPSAIWTVFAEGRTVEFVDGVEIEEPVTGRNGPDAENRNMARLASGLGHYRYSERLARVDMTNVVYVSGTSTYRSDGSATPLSHVVLDYRVLTGEAVLRSQTVIDPLRRVPLLLRKTTVILQYPVDHPVVRVQLGATRLRG